jgi:hypothetical protein
VIVHGLHRGWVDRPLVASNRHGPPFLGHAACGV